MRNFDKDSTTDEVLEGIDLTGQRIVITGTSSGLGLTDVNYKRNIDIVQQDRDGTTLRRWTLSGAWPVKFVAGDWDNESDENVIEAVKSFALFRLINPAKTIKFAAGRETLMNDFQGLLMLSCVNGILTGVYLTTRGRSVEADRKLLDEVGKFHGRHETDHGEA